VKALMQIDREGTRVAAAIDIELSREEIRGLLRRLGRGAQEYRRLLDTIWAQSSSASQREQGEPTELGKLPASAAGRQLMRTQEIYRHIFGPGASANKARTISDWIRSGRLDAIRKRRGFYDVSLASLNALTEAHRADRC
jgi:hypothetical protein